MYLGDSTEAEDGELLKMVVGLKNIAYLDNSLLVFVRKTAREV